MQKEFEQKAVEMKEHDLAMQAFMNVCKITLKQQTMNHDSLWRKSEEINENDIVNTGEMLASELDKNERLKKQKLA